MGVSWLNAGLDIVTGITADQLGTLKTASTTGTSFTITFPSLPTAGSSVVLSMGLNTTGTISSVKDNGTSQSTFTLDVTKTGASNHKSLIYRADGISLPGSGSYTITVTFTGSVSYSVSASAKSYLGKASGAPVSTNTGTATSTTVSTGAATPSVAGSLFIATFQNSSGGSADNPTVTNANFTSEQVNGNGGSGQVFGFADQIKTGNSADTCTWTVGTSAVYSSAIAVYSPASAPAAPAGMLMGAGIV